MLEIIMGFANKDIWHFLIVGIIITSFINATYMFLTELVKNITIWVKGHPETINYIFTYKPGEKDGEEKE